MIDTIEALHAEIADATGLQVVIASSELTGDHVVSSLTTFSTENDTLCQDKAARLSTLSISFSVFATSQQTSMEYANMIVDLLNYRTGLINNTVSVQLIELTGTNTISLNDSRRSITAVDFFITH